MSGSGISWAICKSAPRSTQTTTPAPHHSKFFKAGCALPAAQPTASKHWRHNINNISNLIIITAAIQLTSGHHQILKIVFYPHDAVLTRYESKSCVCHKLVFYWNGWMMELVSGMEASTDLSNTTIQGNLGICKNNVTSFWQFIQTLFYGHLPLLVYRHKVLSS